MNMHPVNPITIKDAAKLLRAGKLVAFPTETVYGLAGDATNDKAVAEIFAVKGRPQFNPLIVHCIDSEMAKRYVSWNPLATTLVKQFCPGPLTLVLKRLPDCPLSLLASAGEDTVAIRFPSHPTARCLLQEAGIPLAAPSANRSGRISPTQAQHVAEELGDHIPYILDGGDCDVGIESTVLDISSDRIALLRPGTVTQEAIELTLGIKIQPEESNANKIRSPGQLASHYAPSLPVRLNVKTPLHTEAYLAFAEPVPLSTAYTRNLSEKGDLREAAAHLFAYLRECDRPDMYSAIAVAPIPDEGIGRAINDRLKRAATR